MPSPTDGARVAVVLAGGASRRFGTDKLAADLAGRPLLDTVVAGLPTTVEVIVVGPSRPLSRPVRFVREQPAGGGPAAALVAGLRLALETDTAIVWVLPGDAPAAGAAAVELDRALAVAAADGAAVVAVDDTDRLQPLQLALSRAAAEQLVRNGGPDAAHGASARRLVETLHPPALRHRIGDRGLADIDTAEQLAAWRAKHLRNDDHA